MIFCEFLVVHNKISAELSAKTLNSIPFFNTKCKYIKITYNVILIPIDNKAK